MKVNGYFGYGGPNLIIAGILIFIFDIPAKMKRRVLSWRREKS